MEYTLEQLRSRHSVRNYEPQVLSHEIMDELSGLVEAINIRYSDALRFAMVYDDPNAFNLFEKHYGTFSGVQNYAVAIIKPQNPNAKEIAGYAGQELAMRAQALGLATCFIGATYDSTELNLHLKDGEEVSFLLTIGKAAQDAKVNNHPSLSPEQFYDSSTAFFNLEEAEKRIPSLAVGLDALACAPSGMNKQPVRVWLAEDTFLHAGLAETTDYSLTDLGIAKFNFQAVVPGVWEWGVGGRFQTK